MIQHTKYSVAGIFLGQSVLCEAWTWLTATRYQWQSKSDQPHHNPVRLSTELDRKPYEPIIVTSSCYLLAASMVRTEYSVSSEKANIQTACANVDAWHM